MDLLLINNIFVLSINILGVILAFWVYLSGRKRKVNQAYLVMTILSIAWIDCAHMSNLSSSDNTIQFWAKIGYGIVPLWLLSLYFFSVRFISGSKYMLRFKMVLSVIIGIFLSAITVFSKLIVCGSEITEWGSLPILGSGKFLYFGIVFIWTILIIGGFIFNYFKADTKSRHRIQYFLLGLSIFVLANLIFNIILTFWKGIPQFYQFGNYSAIFLLGFTAYAIVKHKLFNIKIVLTQILVGVIAILLFVQILGSETTFEYTWKSALFAVFLFFGYLLIKSVNREIHWREELAQKVKEATKELEDRNRDLTTLQNVTYSISSTLDKGEVAQEVVNRIAEDLNYVGGVLSLIDKDGTKMYAAAASKTSGIDKSLQMIGKPLESLHQDLERDRFNFNSITKAAIKNDEQVSSDLKDFISPPVDPELADKIQKMNGIESLVAMPTTVQDKALGTILFALPKPEEEITEQDLTLMKTYSSQAGLAISNASLYEQVKSFNIELKEKVREATADLEEANKHLMKLDKAKSEFVSIASHQLRTPLTAIKGYLSMIMEGTYGDVNRKQAEPLEKIYASSERLIKMVNDLLNLTRIESGRLKMDLEDLDLNKVVKEEGEQLMKVAEKKGLYLKMKLKSDLPEVNTDEQLIRQVIMNLIDNAIKYTEDGGVVVVTRKTEDSIAFEVHDTGIGLSKWEIKKLFHKFSRGSVTKLSPDGSGLGLYAAKQIIEELKGEIWVRSDGKGKGSTFGFSLPLKKKLKANS